MLKQFNAVSRLLIIIGCATSIASCSTTYGKMGLMGGVAAAPITNDTYRISAQGNGYTDATTIQDYALLKAAETTLAAGKTHFTVQGVSDSTDHAIGQTPGSITTNVYGSTAYSTFNPGYTYDIVKPGQDMLITVWSPKKGDILPPGTFDAQEVFDNVNPRVKRSKEG